MVAELDLALRAGRNLGCFLGIAASLDFLLDDSADPNDPQTTFVDLS
jgi:hypothetical protein